MNNSTAVKLKEIINDTTLSPEEALAKLFKLGVVHGIEIALQYNNVLFEGSEKIESIEVKKAVESIKNSQEKFFNEYKKDFETR